MCGRRIELLRFVLFYCCEKVMLGMYGMTAAAPICRIWATVALDMGWICGSGRAIVSSKCDLSQRSPSSAIRLLPTVDDGDTDAEATHSTPVLTSRDLLRERPPSSAATSSPTSDDAEADSKSEADDEADADQTPTQAIWYYNLGYMQVINNKGYDGAKADLWSCGVILFILMAGYLPFEDSNLMKLYKKESRNLVIQQ